MSSGSSSPSNVTQTSKTELPSWLTNANTFGAQQAQNLYNTGGVAPYPGNTVAPLDPMQEQYLSGVENLSTQGSPVTSAAQNYATGVLNGDQLSPSSNPYLQQTFQQAAGAVQNQLGSEFAGAGRNPQASLGAQADQMNNLATQLYGANYEDAANRQASMVPQANPLADQNYVQLSALGNAGAQLQAQTQNMINANQNLYEQSAQQPYVALSNYMDQVNSLANGSTSATTTPYYSNQPSGLTGALGGAATGAEVGSFFTPMGSAIGAGVGGLLGLMGVL